MDHYKSKLNESFSMQEQMDAEMMKNFTLKKRKHDYDSKRQDPRRSYHPSMRQSMVENGMGGNRYTERSGPRSSKQKSKSPRRM